MFVAANDPASDRINLIRAAFSAFSAVGDAFGPGMKEEVRAVAVSIYAGRYYLFNHSDNRLTLDLSRRPSQRGEIRYRSGKSDSTVP